MHSASDILDSKLFYDYLPSDQNNSPSENGVSFDELAKSLQNIEKTVAPNEVNIDDLIVSISGITIFFDNTRLESLVVDWDHILEKLGRYYSLILLSEADRKLRMYIQKLVFFVNSYISKNMTVDTECVLKKLQLQHVWDWYYCDLEDAEYCIVSTNNVAENFIKKIDGVAPVKLHAGLPTQIDRIKPSVLHIGSSYSDGGFVYDASENFATHYDENSPVILKLIYRGEYLVVYNNGTIQKGDTVHTFPSLTNISKARAFNDKLILSDWSLPGKILFLDLATFQVELIDVAPIIIANDFLYEEALDCYYMIDKEQGSVFKFSSSFNYEGKRLSFGRGVGRLYDPISIRKYKNKLAILSWVNGEINIMEPF